jgi:hypothetical protein
MLEEQGSRANSVKWWLACLTVGSDTVVAAGDVARVGIGHRDAWEEQQNNARAKQQQTSANNKGAAADGKGAIEQTKRRLRPEIHSFHCCFSVRSTDHPNVLVCACFLTHDDALAEGRCPRCCQRHGRERGHCGQSQDATEHREGRRGN